MKIQTTEQIINGEPVTTQKIVIDTTDLADFLTLIHDFLNQLIARFGDPTGQMNAARKNSTND